MFNDEELENIQIAIGAILDMWTLTPQGIENFKALEAKVLALRDPHLTKRTLNLLSCGHSASKTVLNIVTKELSCGVCGESQ